MVNGWGNSAFFEGTAGTGKIVLYLGVALLEENKVGPALAELRIRNGYTVWVGAVGKVRETARVDEYPVAEIFMTFVAVDLHLHATIWTTVTITLSSGGTTFSVSVRNSFLTLWAAGVYRS